MANGRIYRLIHNIEDDTYKVQVKFAKAKADLMREHGLYAHPEKWSWQQEGRTYHGKIGKREAIRKYNFISDISIKTYRRRDEF